MALEKGGVGVLSFPSTPDEREVPDANIFKRARMEQPFARSLRARSEIERRQALLGLPHMLELTRYRARLIEEGFGEIPHFDPLDGGTAAKILFLFEKPGPKTSLHGGGSGFISRDNDDATAEATFNFMKLATIPREDSIIWNVVPGWNGTIRLAREEKARGKVALTALLDLLPAVRTVVLVGRQASTVAAPLADRGLKVVTSFHPSPKVRAISPDKWKSIPVAWKDAVSVG